MPDIIKTFLFLVCSISLIIVLLGEMSRRGEIVDIDSQYYNADGDHIYYDRSLIEKKACRKRFPHLSLRKFSELFSRKNSKKV